MRYEKSFLGRCRALQRAEENRNVLFKCMLEMDDLGKIESGGIFWRSTESLAGEESTHQDGWEVIVQVYPPTERASLMNELIQWIDSLTPSERSDLSVPFNIDHIDVFGCVNGAANLFFSTHEKADETHTYEFVPDGFEFELISSNNRELIDKLFSPSDYLLRLIAATCRFPLTRDCSNWVLVEFQE